MQFSFLDDISKITSLTPFHHKLLKDFCGKRLIDLLLHLPRGYLKRKVITKISEVEEGETFILQGIVTDSNIRNNGLSKITIEFGGFDSLDVIYFRGNKGYLETIYRLNSTKILCGKITKNGYKWQMVHPEFVLSENRLDEIPQKEAIYDLTKGITNQFLSKLVSQTFKDTKIIRFPEWLDPKITQDRNFPSFFDALKTLHQSDNKTEIEMQKARERLSFDELLANQIGLKLLKMFYKTDSGRVVKGDGSIRDIVLQKLSFELTNDQKIALKDIYRDQSSKLKMVRMLQGDVGSGKTIVALLSMLNAIEAGFQTVLMVPTEILAQQHFESVSSIIEKSAIDIKVTLLTGTSKKKKQLLEAISRNEFQIIIGTHAIFQEKVKLSNIGLIVIDEQHRFGVNHRAALSSKDEDADLLFMSATPIPRSLSLVQYGYMDQSLIVEKPKNRLPIITNVVSNFQIDVVISKIDDFISRDEKIYWICPLIEESLKIDIIAIENREKLLRQKFGDKLGVIHGRMKDKEINEVMEIFAGRTKKKEDDVLKSTKNYIQSSIVEVITGKPDDVFKEEKEKKLSDRIDILLSTTLIEVGVNVPNATLIVIEDAQRFGLSQLHQLRGRVGRSNLQSYCTLIYNPKSTTATGRQRLQALRNSNDGFYISEQDLKIRGGGELTGLRQSGFGTYKIADPQENVALLSEISELATEIAEKSTSFENLKPAYQELLKIFNVQEINSGGF